MAARGRRLSETPGSEVLVRQMGLTHAEFLRCLPAAVAGMDWRVDGARIHVQLRTGWLEIRLGAEGVRRIAALSIPNIEVSLRFEGVSEAAKKAFLVRFDSAYQRGGG